MKYYKFTFKNNTDIWHPKNDNVDIKLNKIWVGSIYKFPKVHIRLMILKDDPENSDNPNCVWEWQTLSETFETVDEAKLWLNENRIELQNNLNIHIAED